MHSQLFELILNTFKGEKNMGKFQVSMGHKTGPKGLGSTGPRVGPIGPCCKQYLAGKNKKKKEKKK